MRYPRLAEQVASAVKPTVPWSDAVARACCSAKSCPTSGEADRGALDRHGLGAGRRAQDPPRRPTCTTASGISGQLSVPAAEVAAQRADADLRRRRRSPDPRAAHRCVRCAAGSMQIVESLDCAGHTIGAQVTRAAQAILGPA